MELPINIRQFYKPVQPSSRHASVEVVYHEFFPHPLLHHTIFCYWELKTTKKLSEFFKYRVVADGCIDIFFDLSNPSESFVMGFCNKFTEFPLPGPFHYFGIRFFPTIFPQIFKIDASQLSNSATELSVVVPSVAKLIKNCLSEDVAVSQIKGILDNYFLKIIKHTEFNNDARFYNSLDLILKSSGRVNIKDLNTGLSERQLRRVFQYFVGDTAKAFGKVVRFQTLLNATSESKNVGKNKLFFDAGYYDQAHFIKEFKELYGTTPGEAFKALTII